MSGPVLRLDMVDKSTGPRQTHFGWVFGDEAVQASLLQSEAPPSSPMDTFTHLSTT
jgi:hypothetical protein